MCVTLMHNTRKPSSSSYDVAFLRGAKKTLSTVCCVRVGVKMSRALLLSVRSSFSF